MSKVMSAVLDVNPRYVGGLFASKKSLESKAGIIGTKNPMAARVVCGLGFLVGTGAVFVPILSLVGKL